MRLENKTAIVTGAGSGFGAGIARKFAAEGAQVMVADIDGSAAKEVADEIGGQAHAVDVANGEDVAKMVDAAFAAFGHVDILINNAGITHKPMPMEDVPEEQFDRVFAVKCKRMFELRVDFPGLVHKIMNSLDIILRCFLRRMTTTRNLYMHRRDMLATLLVDPYPSRAAQVLQRYRYRNAMSDHPPETIIPETRQVRDALAGAIFRRSDIGSRTNSSCSRFFSYFLDL